MVGGLDLASELHSKVGTNNGELSTLGNIHNLQTAKSTNWDSALLKLKIPFCRTNSPEAAHVKDN